MDAHTTKHGISWQSRNYRRRRIYLNILAIDTTIRQRIIDNNQTLSLARGGMSAGAYLISFYDNNGIAKRAKIVVQ